MTSAQSTPPDTSEHSTANKPSKILIVRLSAIGDVLHTLPALEALRAEYPDAEIGWVVEPPAHLFLEGHPALTRVHLFERKKWRREGRRVHAEKSRDFFKSLRKCGYEVAIDFQGNAKGGLVSRGSGAPRRIGFAGPESRELNRVFQTERYAASPKALHVIDKNIALASALATEPATEPVKPRAKGRTSRTVSSRYAPGQAPKPRFPPLPDLRGVVDDAFLEDGRGPIVALNPGAGWEAKRWPPESFGRLAVLLKKAASDALIAVTLGPDEDDLLTGIRQGIEKADADPDAVLTPLPILKLLQLAAFLQRCDLFVSGDTGPVHLAAALGTPVVALFAEVPVERNGPYGDKVRIIDRCHERPKRWFWQNRHTVPKGGYPIARISPEEVEALCREFLDEKGRSGR